MIETSGSSEKSSSIFGEDSLWIAYALSLLVAVLIIAASILSLLFTEAIYRTEDLRQSFFANDVVNLLVGLPTLLVALWMAWRGKLVGSLFWLGALFYVFYNYLAYLFSVPIGWCYILLLSLVVISGYSLIGLVSRIDAVAVGKKLAGSVPTRFPGGLLIVFGAFVFLRVFIVIANALTDPAAVPASELAILPADFLIAPAWMIGGVLLWQRKPLGYVAGLGLLFQASMLFIGLIAVLILQPLLTEATFDLASVITVFIMGMVCFIPFALYLRGVAGTSGSSRS